MATAALIQTKTEHTMQAAKAMQAVLSLKNISKTYLLEQQQVTALGGVSLEVKQGEFVTIVGPSGSGKSTLMNLIGCLDRPSSGEYRLVGQLVSKMSRAELARIRNRRIGFIFQSFNLLPGVTALSNVELPLIYAGIGPVEREVRARQMLQLVGLGNRLSHLPMQLSGGQQQRIAIARALINRPSLLLADEPTGALDSHTGAEIMELFHSLHRQGLTIVLVTHDPNIAAIAERQIVLRDGQIVYDGNALPR
jgi:putative ABC transport system ATP-binding protein